jgi:hypothetical protein
LAYCHKHEDLQKEAAASTSSWWGNKASIVVRQHFLKRLCLPNFDSNLTQIMTELSPFLLAAAQQPFKGKPLAELTISKVAASKVPQNLTENGSCKRLAWSLAELAEFEEGLKLHKRGEGKYAWNEIAKMALLVKNRTGQDCRDKYKSLYPTNKKQKIEKK